ncbi:MAG: SGNH/GDSL hydrolase family protein [Candidatus Zixiibacteriota bacterium]|nr:MAG: SGNH/GDSL hydrolase family protein [candidate division Zixibacteria bacterium]
MSTLLMAAAVSLVLFVSIVEVGLRLADPDLSYTSSSFPVNRDINFSEVYEMDTQLFWRFRRATLIDSRRYSGLSYQVNSLRMRGKEISTLTDDYRIVAIGNSCTFGWGIPQQYTWVDLLETILNIRKPENRVQVLNAGVPGYTSYQGWQYFKRDLLDLDPNMVLIMFGWNDHWPAGKRIEDARQKMPGRVLVSVHNLLSRLKLYQLLRKAASSAVGEPVTESLGDLADDHSSPRRVALDEFVKNLEAMIALARENDAKPVLMIPPVASPQIYYEGRPWNLHYLHEPYQGCIRSVASQHSVPVIDLQAAFDRSANLFDRHQTDPIHFNVKGHRLVAAAAADVVSPLISETSAQ